MHCVTIIVNKQETKKDSVKGEDNSRRTAVTNDSDTFIPKFNIVFPSCRMKDRTLEFVFSREILGKIRTHEAANGVYEELCFYS